MVTTVAIVGILSGEAKFNIDKRLIYFPVLISVMLLVRQDSYQSILSNEGLILFDPRPIAQYIEFNENWVIPDEGDQCWVNLECTMNKDDIQIIQRQNFKIAYKY